MALTRHWHHIPGSGQDMLALAPAEPCGGPIKCKVCQEDCVNYREPPVQIHRVSVEETYDENTLEKVRRILDNVNSISYTGDEIIMMLQNEGILFRERS